MNQLHIITVGISLLVDYLHETYRVAITLSVCDVPF
jgi:hypothetical protein